MSVEAILQAVESLTPSEQAALLEQLNEKYGGDEAPFSKSQELMDLLDERVKEADSNDHPGYTWDEVVKFVKRKR